MEKNILIINLKRFGDIYQATQLIDSIIAVDPLMNIEMLVYSEFEKVTKTIQNISKAHIIDREKIISLKNNPVYSDAFSVNELFVALEPLRKRKWDKVINYSGDNVSTYITSYLATEDNCLGVSFNEKNIIKYSNRWSMVFNDLLTSYKYTPINFSDTLHNMVGVKRAEGANHIITNEKHNIVAADNLNRIRQKESETLRRAKGSTGTETVKIVGLQLITSQADKNIPLNVMIELLGMLLDDPQKYPVLLIAPNETERRYVNRLNEYFDNKLVTIESDFVALPSVLSNIDLLVAPDTVVKHLADLLKTPVVEVSLGSGPFLKQGTNNVGNLILTDLLETRVWFDGQIGSNDGKSKQTNIKAEDIFNAITVYFNSALETTTTLSSKISLYRVEKDSKGTIYRPVSGDVNASVEIMRLLSRHTLFTLMGIKDFSDLEEMIASWPSAAVVEIIKTSRDNVVLATKLLLNTLRCLIKTKEGSRYGQAFLNALDELLVECDAHQITSIPIIFFRAKLEALSSSSAEQNISDVETLLYDLKANVQMIIAILNTIENKVMERIRAEKEKKNDSTNEAADGN